MLSKINFADLLVASSYVNPGGREVYEPLCNAMIAL
jgi:xylose isomerase